MPVLIIVLIISLGTSGFCVSSILSKLNSSKSRTYHLNNFAFKGIPREEIKVIDDGKGFIQAMYIKNNVIHTMMTN